MTHLKVGDQAPNFVGIDQAGVKHQLNDYKGKKLVVFFYPKASTPGCTAEVCNLRDNYQVLKEQGYELLGVSADSAERQQKFITKNSLPFPLLADESKEVLHAFGVWGPKKFMGRTYDGIHRMTFVINEEGVLSQIIDKVKTKDHAAQILAS
ncbi:peroxiredoxin Q/BCP [Myroides gitamensis]|uniref:thioredoxin-dependent peroxiredoxin n=1 Tax=Myroides odoratus TaxID=256 RepID=A0A378RK16_MYROD|nr:thioredoxin-dependent thiol peroxidase [Myroides odoratus]MCS4238519.1 peroxiredoxin Q/BCP [Myroides odoratus]MDH6600549.1 peroxiredoxin Q/BCP [Myroides gitamensis]QQU05193.1 thioredoxin-dependent thiol peroxidase [Myroides odoratus]STZ27315.1 Putative peroxiredoxin bcp [Myroides odoratus]